MWPASPVAGARGGEGQGVAAAVVVVIYITHVSLVVFLLMLLLFFIVIDTAIVDFITVQPFDLYNMFIFDNFLV